MQISLTLYSLTERNLSYLPISTTLTLKQKRHMYYMPMEFDGLKDPGVLTIAISEQDHNNSLSVDSKTQKTWKSQSLSKTTTKLNYYQ